MVVFSAVNLEFVRKTSFQLALAMKRLEVIPCFLIWYIICIQIHDNFLPYSGWGQRLSGF